MVVDWRAFGGGIIVEHVFLLWGEKVVGRSWDTEGSRNVIVAYLDLDVTLELVDSGFDGPARRFVGDGLTGEDCFADETVLDLVKVGDVLEWWQDISRWNRDFGRNRGSLQSETVFKQAGCGCWRVEQDCRWSAVRLTRV